MLNNPQERQRMGARAVNLVESSYTWSAIACRMAQFYEQVLADQTL